MVVVISCSGCHCCSQFLNCTMQSIPKALNVLKNGGKIEEAKCLCPIKSILQLDRVEVRTF